ncbi:MAG: hypothetical protein VKJ24_01470 [Synechococcales bacterium]|nr:hypothetical protein [Synechococcales bacterium]
MSLDRESSDRPSNRSEFTANPGMVWAVQPWSPSKSTIMVYSSG